MQHKNLLEPDKLYILYDAKCPLCSMEMSHLKALDKRQKIELVDIHDEKFGQRFPDVAPSDAMRILHGYYQNQQLLALDVTYRAWSIVGRGFWVQPLRLPIVKQLAHAVYLLFAKHRYAISSFCFRYLNIGKDVCDTGACYVDDNKTNRRR